jgi:hypothetical protein
MRKTLILAALAVVIVGAPALAYHDGGVAHCNGCHTMHNSENGVAMNFNTLGTGPGTLPGTGYDSLLLYENRTDICLDCHDGGGSYHVWSADPAAPGSANRGGGDFVFLEEDNLNDGHGGADPGEEILGYEAGHSLASGIHSTASDPVLNVSPGGTFNSIDLACTSCHDPHGNSSFRLTYQDGQSLITATSGTITWTATIDADPISLFGGGPSSTNHNAYKGGYSAWCGTCHGDFHAASGSNIHPAGETLGVSIAQAYNAYDGTSDCIANPPAGGNPCGSGGFATAYLVEVPFEDAGADTGSADGPTSSSMVACVTCHRAHATSAPNAGRWDFNVTGLAEDGHESSSYTIPNPYDGFQRSLCNKCHSKDEFDEAEDFTP